MIDIPEGDIVATERTSRGRFVIFTRTDVQPGWPLPWWGVVLDSGADGLSILARLNTAAAPEGWTGRQLLAVVLARLRGEYARNPAAAAAGAVLQLEGLAKTWPNDPAGRQPESPIRFLPGAAASAYPWDIAKVAGLHLALCPDPAGRDEGTTPEQILLVLRRLLADALYSRENGNWLRAAERHAALALAAEIRRVASMA
jgi:hypothetical protein